MIRVACYYKSPRKLVYYVEPKRTVMVDCKSLPEAKKLIAASAVDQAMITQQGQTVMH